MADERQAHHHNFRGVIRVEGHLEMKSAGRSVTITSDDARLFCYLEGWPPGLSLKRLQSLRKSTRQFPLQPVHIYFNNHRLGVYKQGKLKHLHLPTAINALIGYLRS